MLTLMALLACSPDIDSKTLPGEGTDTGTSDTGASDTEATGWTEESHLKGTDGDYDRVFPTDSVTRLDIVLSAESAALMQSDLAELLGGSDEGPGGEDGGVAEDPVTVPAMVWFEGRSWPSVGMRHKGNSSLKKPYQAGITKLPFRLDFDHFEDDVPEIEDQRFWGFEDLKLANGFKDDSLIRDLVVSNSMRESGIPAARGGLTEVWVDSGEGAVFWGLYAMFEDPCGEMLDSLFEDDDGNCYKAEGRGATLATYDRDSFENKTNDEDGDWSDLETLVELLADESLSPADWRAALEGVLDVDSVLRGHGANLLAGNWDTYGLAPHNYYLYGDSAQDGRLVWVPWDFGLSYAASGIRTPLSLSMDEVGAEWPLLRRLMDDPVYAADYRVHISERVAGPFDPDAQRAEMLRLHELAAPSVAQEVAPYTCQSSAGAFDASLEDADDALFAWLDQIEVETAALLE
jgi:spore coat protein H